jgi:AbrB family looped-hinge helix DNA binding protein
MRTTIDKAGRVVIPRALRDQVGLTAGEVEVSVDGAGVRIEPIAGEGLVEVGGRLVIPASGVAVDDATVRTLLDAGRH